MTLDSMISGIKSVASAGSGRKKLGVFLSIDHFFFYESNWGQAWPPATWLFSFNLGMRACHMAFQLQFGIVEKNYGFSALYFITMGIGLK